jgi:small subunit ribosomal protein S12
MAKGLYAAKKCLKESRKYKKKVGARYSVKAEGAGIFRAIAIAKKVEGAKQPSSGNRKCVKIQILKNGQKSVAYIPGDHAKDFIADNDTLHIAGIGGSKGKTKGDIPVCVFKVIKVNGVSLRDLVLGRRFKKNI